ncbi:DUF3999 domain-containing protein [Ralstonia solanacearum]|uniref:DUF3999 domain-containing protein n=1 Tax=Ralstonia solanacearum TaxID=305 RepID=UPI0018685894|nr:DUF3999 domain-containing protein [Ralstonia solanacearum]QOK82917.1 DUF3999 domain-containing protein [Ralstonia solanacearum]
MSRQRAAGGRVQNIVWTAVAALSLSTPAWAERFALTGAPGASYYAVTLGADVYAHSRDAGLADLRILNGDGEPVPFAIETPRDAAPQARTLREVRWFATPAEEGSTPGTPGVVLGTDGVLRATGPAPAQASARAWLLDLSPLREAVTAVVVGLPAAEFQGGVSVQASDDLQHWSPITRAMLFRLTNQGSTLVQDRIELAGVHARYLRLTWQGKPPAPDTVRVELAAGAPGVPADSGIQWRAGLVPAQVPGAGDYLFDTGGAFPVERVKIRLPQSNTVVQASLSARADARAPWRPVTSVRLFRLAGAGGQGEQGSPPIVVPATGERYWRLQVDIRSGGLGVGAPALSIGWRPATVTYAARGNVPFVLAVGEVADGSPVARAELLAGAAPAIVPAQLGMMTASPAQALRREPPGGTTRQWVLWGALVAAVAVLGGMAWRLFRVSGTPADTSH